MPSDLSNNASMTLYVMEEPSRIPLQPSDQPARYLGKGKLGHVYLADGRPEAAAHSRWSHAQYDIATALEVTESKPEKPSRRAIWPTIHHSGLALPWGFTA